MQQKPQRPFVPHRTPNASRPATTHSEFRVSRPFVPGSVREEPVAVSGQADVGVDAHQRTDRAQLPPIEVFLDEEAVRGDEESHEIPPVEHFLDPIPAVGSFAPDAEGALLDESAVSVGYSPGAASGPPATEAGWGVDDWQRYDWRGAATLGDTVESQASNEWATTDWDAGSGKPGTRNKLTPAQAIANALDQIAQQIREGDLTVPSPGLSLTDPGTIAATLAALLGVKR
ncbi:MAG: hypothetical protein QOK07_1679 [Gemmatimonadaceae bacterium]|nr:hypothetical protein [Gemmatimonadaceae bacterium]